MRALNKAFGDRVIVKDFYYKEENGKIYGELFISYDFLSRYNTTGNYTEKGYMQIVESDLLRFSMDLNNKWTKASSWALPELEMALKIRLIPTALKEAEFFYENCLDAGVFLREKIE